MTKKVKLITKTQFKIGIVIVVILFIGLLYFVINEDRLQVHENDGFFVGTPLIPQGETLSYKTEFCANKLSNLAHEAHFLEKDIREELELIKKDSSEFRKEEGAVEIEQEVLSELKSEFQKYKNMCDLFDQNPTEELCNQFLEEAKQSLELAQENAKAAESKSVMEKIKISFNDLIKANRIYSNLQKICKGD